MRRTHRGAAALCLGASLPADLARTGAAHSRGRTELVPTCLGRDNAPPIYDPHADPNGPDGGFELDEHASFDTARQLWEAEIAHARANCADQQLDQTSPFLGAHVTLRWIYTHMIGEYARHNGHASVAAHAQSSPRTRGMCGCTGGLLSGGPHTCHCSCRDLKSATTVVANELASPGRPDPPGRLGCWGRHQR